MLGLNRDHVGRILPLALMLILANGGDVFAGGKVGVYGIRMVPYGAAAESYSRAGWGGGMELVVPFDQNYSMIAGTFGLEGVNLMSQTEYLRDPTTGLEINQETSQNYFRVFLGAQIGGYGDAFFRPHIGANIAYVYYNIRTDLVVPDQYDPSQEVRQNLSDVGHGVFGYDLTMGVDLNVSKNYSIDGGVKYLKSLSVPQQLGAGSVKVFPQYFQIYLEVGISLDYIWSKTLESGEGTSEG